MGQLNVLLIAATAALAGGAVRAQVPFTHEEAGFAVSFPAAPQSEARPAENPDQPSFRRYWTEGAATFSVTIDQFPPGLRLPRAGNGTYRRLLDSHARQESAELVAVYSCTLSGSPCLEGVFRFPGGVAEVRRVLIVNSRVFQLSVSAPGDRPSPAAAAFFDTFRTPAPAPVRWAFGQEEGGASTYNSQANTAAVEQNWPAQIVAAAKAYRVQPILMHQFNLATGYLNTGRTALAVPLFEDVAERGHWTYLRPVYDYRNLARRRFVRGSLADEATRRLEAVAPARTSAAAPRSLGNPVPPR